MTTTLTYFNVTADWLAGSNLGSLTGIVTFSMAIQVGNVLAAPTLSTPGIVVPITVTGRINNGVLYGLDGNPYVTLIANTAPLGLTGNLYYTVGFQDVFYNYTQSSIATQQLNISGFSFQAPTTNTTVDLSTVTPAAAASAAQVASVTSTNITDATTLGRELLTASSQSAALSYLGALGGTKKLVSIGDQGYGICASSGSYTSTAGTSEMMFTVGPYATGLAAMFTNFYSGSGDVDADPTGTITFNASIRVVSSTNPGTTTGTIYRLTFGGRTTATLDPGGIAVSDPVGISVAPGDVVAVRTYLATGTGYVPRALTGSSGWGGFTASTDLTAPGSAAIAASVGLYYGPAALLGNTIGSPPAKSVLVVGDSIGVGLTDDAFWTQPSLGIGGFAIRALSGIAGIINVAVVGDTAENFETTTGSFHRLRSAAYCNSAIIEYGTNDIYGAVTAAVLEPVQLNIANALRNLGIGKVFLTTLIPRTTSTDGWATTTNQTPLSTESQRVAYNNWVRAQCPLNPTTLAPVAVGTPGALLAGSFGHPITGIFDTCSYVETSLNSGLWLPCNRTATGSITSGQQILTSSGANFQSAIQESGGDLGTTVNVLGAGASASVLSGHIEIVSSSTQVYLDALAGTTVTNAQINIGTCTSEGTHPTPRGHNLMKQAINPGLL